MGKFAKKQLLGKYAREAQITNIETMIVPSNCPFPLKSHMKDGSEQRYCVMTTDALT